MSPSKKKLPRSVTRQPHARQRHGASAPPQPPAEPPADPTEAACRILTNLVERLGADGAHKLIAFAAELADKSYSDVAMMLNAGAAPAAALGVEVAALSPHRRALAMHLVVQNTNGAAIAAEEEDRIAKFFGDALDRAVALTGGSQPNSPGSESRDTNPAAAAIWFLLIADRAHGRSARPRCPVLNAVSCPGEAGFLTEMRAGVEGYARTALATATERDLDLLRRILIATPEEIDELCRPLGTYFGEDVPDEAGRDAALQNLPRRYATNEQICSGVEGWASWYSDERAEHDIPPVYRLAAVAWLAHVALRGEVAS
jgi:hypothetical protein